MRLRYLSLALALGVAIAAPRAARADAFTLNLEANANTPLVPPTSGNFGTVTLTVVNGAVQVNVAAAAGVPLNEFAFLFNGPSSLAISHATAGLTTGGPYQFETFGNYTNSVIYDGANLTSFQFDLASVGNIATVAELASGGHPDAYFDLVTDDFTNNTQYEIASTERAAAVPESPTLWLLAGALPLLAWYRRRAVG